MRKRYILEAVGIAAVGILLVMAVQVVRGYLATKSYVPDIVQEYESVSQLQSEVSFGLVLRLDGWSLFVGAILLLIWIVCYGKVRNWLSQRLGK